MSGSEAAELAHQALRPDGASSSSPPWRAWWRVPDAPARQPMQGRIVADEILALLAQIGRTETHGKQRGAQLFDDPERLPGRELAPAGLAAAPWASRQLAARRAAPDHRLEIPVSRRGIRPRHRELRADSPPSPPRATSGCR